MTDDDRFVELALLLAGALKRMDERITALEEQIKKMQEPGGDPDGYQ